MYSIPSWLVHQHTEGCDQSRSFYYALIYLFILNNLIVRTMQDLNPNYSRKNNKNLAKMLLVEKCWLFK